MESPATAAPTQQDEALKAYYSNRRLLVRNALFILLGNWGHTICFVVVGPLILLRVTSTVSNSFWGMMNSVNSWVVAFLVMYFSWKSDHTISRFGRRIPYLFISAPFIIASIGSRTSCARASWRRRR